MPFLHRMPLCSIRCFCIVSILETVVAFLLIDAVFPFLLQYNKEEALPGGQAALWVGFAAAGTAEKEEDVFCKEELQMTPQIALVLGAFLFMIVFMIWGVIEPCVVVMLSLGFLWFTGVLDTATAFGQFSGNTIIVMIFMMICSAGLMKTNILLHITKIVKKLNGGERVLYLVAMLTPFILCQFMGGVSSLMTTVPLLVGLADTNNIPRTKLILPALVGSQFGIGLFPIGMSTSLYLQKNEFLESLNSPYTLGFWDIMGTRLPGVIAGFLFVLLIGYKLLPEVPGRTSSDIPESISLKPSDLPKWKENASYIIFIAVLLGMIFNNQLGFSGGQIAFAGGVLYMLLGILPQREAFHAVNWPIVFMVAFGVAMAAALKSSGAADLIASFAGNFITSDSNLILICVIVFIFCAVVTQFFDNNTLVNIMTPLMIAACGGVGLNPLPVICCVDLSSMASIMTPLSGPGGMLAYTMGGYSYKDMIKFGAPIILVQALVTAVWVPFYFGLM